MSLVDVDSVREMEEKDLAERRKKEEEAKILEAIERERIKAEQEKRAAEEREARRREYERKLELQKKVCAADFLLRFFFAKSTVVICKERIRREVCSVFC